MTLPLEVISVTPRVRFTEKDSKQLLKSMRRNTIFAGLIAIAVLGLGFYVLTVGGSSGTKAWIKDFGEPFAALLAALTTVLSVVLIQIQLELTHRAMRGEIGADPKLSFKQLDLETAAPNQISATNEHARQYASNALPNNIRAFEISGTDTYEMLEIHNRANRDMDNVKIKLKLRTGLFTFKTFNYEVNGSLGADQSFDFSVWPCALMPNYVLSALVSYKDAAGEHKAISEKVRR